MTCLHIRRLKLWTLWAWDQFAYTQVPSRDLTYIRVFPALLFPSAFSAVATNKMIIKLFSKAIKCGGGSRYRNRIRRGRLSCLILSSITFWLQGLYCVLYNFIFAVLRTETNAWCVSEKHSTTELELKFYVILAFKTLFSSVVNQRLKYPCY